MSGKRTLKKLQKRQDSARAQLEELYLRGADDEFLALAAVEIKDPAASLLAAEWAEVAGRVLRQSLARADLGRLERLLPSLRRGGKILSEVTLAEAVLDLAAGRIEDARSRLATLAAPEGEETAFPRDLIGALQSLAQDRPDSRWPLDDPWLQAAEQLFRALQSLEAQGFTPALADREDLARRLDTLRAAVSAATPPDAGEIHRLLDSAGRCLSLLADLDDLDEKLDRLPESDRSSAGEAVTSWLRGPGPLLAATLTMGGPALLAPLQHTVRLRWRAVLERVAAREGSPGLAALCAADPKLFAGDVSLPGGLQAGLASLRQAAQARQLLAGRRYEDLAQLLRSRNRTATDPGEIAVLWSLELWAIGQIRDDGRAEPPPHRAVLRLQQMAGEIRHRLTAKHRIEAARALRDKLFGLCRKTFFCEHVAWAALSLLEHLPDDAGLLIAGFAGAVAGEDAKALRALETRRARGIVARQPRDLEIARLLMIEITREDPWNLAPILDLVRPFFTDDTWPEIAALVAREMVGTFASTLREESLDDEDDIGLTRSALDSLRPMLAGTPGFAAVEVCLDCWQASPRALEKRLSKFLSGFPGLDAPLAAFRMLDRALFPGAPKGRVMALHRLAPIVIERLDARWQLWSPSLLSLAMSVERDDRKNLAKKIQQLLSTPELAADGRATLTEALQMIQDLVRLERPPSRPPQKRKPRTRRSAPTPQAPLDL